MNSATRNQIVAAKERLHRMTEEAREIEQRRAAKLYWEKTEAEERAQEAARMLYHQKQAKYLAQKEKNRVEEKAKEEKEYLSLHNKTVKQVLSQVAKANGQSKDRDDDGDDGTSDEESESNGSESDGHTEHQNNINTGQDGGRVLTGKEGEKDGEKERVELGKSECLFSLR